MDETFRHYEILGLKPGASAADIKQAYRSLVKLWHPDRFSHNFRLQQKAQEKLKEINTAYEKIRDLYSGSPWPVHPAAPRKNKFEPSPSSRGDTPDKHQGAGNPPPTLPAAFSIKNLWPYLVLGILCLGLFHLARQPAKKDNLQPLISAPKVVKTAPQPYKASESNTSPLCEPAKSSLPQDFALPQAEKPPISVSPAERLERKDTRLGELTISPSPLHPRFRPPGWPRHRPPPPPYLRPPGGLRHRPSPPHLRPEARMDRRP